MVSSQSEQSIYGIDDNTSESHTEVIHISQLTEDTFAQAVGAENSASVIEFFADWCKPCHKFSPVFQEVANNFPKINFYKVDADKEFLLAATFKAVTLPTVLYVKDGVIKDVTVGNISKEAFIESIQKII